MSWTLSQQNYHCGTAPGRVEECCSALCFCNFSFTWSSHIIFFIILYFCYIFRQLLVPNQCRSINYYSLKLERHLFFADFWATRQVSQYCTRTSKVKLKVMEQDARIENRPVINLVRTRRYWNTCVCMCVYVHI